MASRPRPPSPPGPGRGRSGRRPSRPAPATRRTSRDAAPTPEPRQHPRATLTGRAAILLLVVAVLGVSYASSIRAWLNQRSEINTLSGQIAAQRTAVNRLDQAKRRWQDPAYIQTQARLRFGWVMPGERGYRVIGRSGRVLSAATTGTLADPAAPAPKPVPAWWETAWGSVEEAGQPSTPARPRGSTGHTGTRPGHPAHR